MTNLSIKNMLQYRSLFLYFLMFNWDHWHFLSFSVWVKCWQFSEFGKSWWLLLCICYCSVYRLVACKSYRMRWQLHMSYLLLISCNTHNNSASKMVKKTKAQRLILARNCKQSVVHKDLYLIYIIFIYIYIILYNI